MTAPAHSQPPLDADVTTYASVSEVNAILAARLYRGAWTNASASPSADGYLVNGALNIGDTVIAVDTGAGDWTVGAGFTIAGDPTTYLVTVAVTDPVTAITIAAPGLVAAPADDAVITRVTPNEREAAVMWATSNLDGQWDWVGSQRFPTRGTQTTAVQHQNLRWPRSGAVDLDGNYFEDDAYPAQLVELTAEYTLYLLERNLASVPDVMGLGFKRAEIPGPLKVEVDEKMTISMLPDYLWTKYRVLGEPAPGARPGRMSFVSMRRA